MRRVGAIHCEYGEIKSERKTSGERNREIIGVERQNRRVRENLDKCSQKDFICDQRRPREDIESRMEIPPRSIVNMKSQDSPAYLITGDEMVNFIRIRAKTSQRVLNVRLGILLGIIRNRAKEQGAPIIKHKRRVEESPLEGNSIGGGSLFQICQIID